MHDRPPFPTHQEVLDLKRIDDDHHLSLFFYPLNNTFLAGRITNEMKFAKLQISRVILFNEYLQKEI
jgi:hypothetical protein